MFRNLVESGSHARDLKRRGAFFAAALAFYAVLICAAGVASIYAYNARVGDADELELHTLMVFQPQAKRPEPETPEPARAASPSRDQNFARREVISVITPYNRNNGVARPETREVAPGLTVIKGIDTGIDPPPFTGPVAVGPPSFGGPDGRDRGGVLVKDDGESAPEVKTPPARETTTPEGPKGPLRLTSSIITSKAIAKPVPVYPDFARRVLAQGTVPVQILIDEQGRVVSAQATGGHPLLHKPAADAALRARFTPTLLGGRPVKVSGIIFYNFKLQ